MIYRGVSSSSYESPRGEFRDIEPFPGAGGRRRCEADAIPVFFCFGRVPFGILKTSRRAEDSPTRTYRLADTGRRVVVTAVSGRVENVSRPLGRAFGNPPTTPSRFKTALGVVISGGDASTAFVICDFVKIFTRNYVFRRFHTFI